MKKYILTFLLFFLVFFVVGFLGAGRFKETPDYLRLYIISNLELIEAEGQYALLFRPSKEGVWLLYPQDNSSRFIDPALALSSLATSQTSVIPVGKELLGGFLGGATAWQLKDVIGAVNKDKKSWRQALAAVLGGITGYSAGFWCGNRRPPDPAAITQILSDPKEYHNLERLAFLVLYKEKGLRVNSGMAKAYLLDLDEKRWIAEARSFKDVVHRARNPNYDFLSSDFRYFRYANLEDAPNPIVRADG